MLGKEFTSLRQKDSQDLPLVTSHRRFSKSKCGLVSDESCVPDSRVGWG